MTHLIATILAIHLLCLNLAHGAEKTGLMVCQKSGLGTLMYDNGPWFGYANFRMNYELDGASLILSNITGIIDVEYKAESLEELFDENDKARVTLLFHESKVTAEINEERSPYYLFHNFNPTYGDTETNGYLAVSPDFTQVKYIFDIGPFGAIAFTSCQVD